jgi:hypothetical protein
MSGATSVSSQTVTNTGFAIATGDLIVAIVRIGSSGESTATCSDNVNPGNYTQAHYQEDTSNGRALIQYYKANSASALSGSLTITCRYPVANHAYLGALDYSGAATSSPLDGHIGTTFTTDTASPTSGSITPTQSGDLLVGTVYISESRTVTVSSESTGFTKELTGNEGTANFQHAHTADEVLSGASAQNYHPTFSASITTMDILTAYKASGGGGASVSLSSTSLTFASQLVGSTSAAQTVTLNNTGNAALSVTSIVASGDYAQTNTCGTSVAAGANCTISVTFTPTATGTRTGAITITDNASGSPQSVNLTGTGAASASMVSLSATNLSFGNQQLNTTSAAQTVTLNNTGNAALSVTSIVASGDYAQTNTCGTSVAAAANCTISVTFTPTAIGTRTGAITITDNAAGSPHTVSLTGTGTSPVLSLSSTTLTFGSQLMNTTSAAQSVTLNNTGNAALSVTSIVASGDYAQTNTCGSSVAAGANCTISVTFTPTATGTRTGAITITDNAAGSPHIVSLTGTGSAILTYSIRPTGKFTEAMSGNTGVSSQTVTNTGFAIATGDLIVAIVRIGNSGESTSTCSDNVNPGNYAQAHYQEDASNGRALIQYYKANSASALSGSLTIICRYPVPNHAYLGALDYSGAATSSPLDGHIGTTFTTATGSPTSGSITPTQSGDLLVGSLYISEGSTVTVSSESTGFTKELTGNEGTANFQHAHSADEVLSGASAQNYHPTFSASITTMDILTAYKAWGGGSASVSLSSTSLTFASQLVGSTSAAQTVTLNNTGNAALSVTSIAASGDYAQTNTCGTSVAAGANCTISVTFTPTATGTRTGAITITDNASGSPHIVSLTGTGN